MSCSDFLSRIKNARVRFYGGGHRESIEPKKSGLEATHIRLRRPDPAPPCPLCIHHCLGRGWIGPPRIPPKPITICKIPKQRWELLAIFYFETEFDPYRLTHDVIVGQNGSNIGQFRKFFIIRAIFTLEQNQRHQCVCFDPWIRIMCSLTS